MALVNTLAYYDTAKITAVKSFIVLANGSQKFNKWTLIACIQYLGLNSQHFLFFVTNEWAQ